MPCLRASVARTGYRRCRAHLLRDSSRQTLISSARVRRSDPCKVAMPLGVWANLVAKMLTLGNGAGETSGTTATLVVVDGLTVTVASVGDSRCILDTNGGEVSLLTVDHRLEENAEERERVTASGGEVSRLNLCGGQEVMA